MAERSGWVTFAELFAIGVAVALIGDASHVQAGITEFLWDLPAIWKSAIWFPLLVGTKIALGGLIGDRLGLARKEHDRAEGLIAAALILGVYCLTTLVADQQEIAGNGICWAIAIVIWLWWDPHLPAMVFGLVTMVIGPAAEIVVVELGASRYLPGYDALLGVPPWLLPLYFATGVVLSGIWRALRS